MLLLSSASFPRYGLERFFAFAQKAGYNGVEIVIGTNFDTQDPAYLQKLSDEYAMPIRAFSLPDRGAEKFTKAFQETVKHFPGASINLSSPEIFSHGYKNWVTKTAPKLAKKYQLNFNLRNSEFKLLLGFIPLRSENSLYSLRSAGNVSLDLSALWSSNQEIMRAIGFLGSKLKHVYLSNVQRGRPYGPIDGGVLPLESFLTKLAQMKYNHDMTLRLTPRQLHEGDEERMLEVLGRCRSFYDKYFTQVYDRHA